MSDGEAPFKTLLGFATVKDQYGHDMHKTAGNSIEFIAAADKGGITKDAKGNDVPFTAIGADVMRWLYCRQSPAQNLNFGPEPANEVRSKFIFKLWNTYSLFCNCAIGDGFDPASKEQLVSHADLADIDRWILSRLQVLIQTARDSFEKYDAMTFALAAERFVDDDLSNWYVRRVKPRLNSKVADLDAAGLRDKWAAYRTLYGVLTSLCQCLAPCVPFLTEVIWKGLGETESVHLSEFPKADGRLLDPALMEQMDALRDIITLGGAARNAAKIKVRQPLAELIVRTAGDADVVAIAQFDQLIRDELNVKKVTALPADAESLMVATMKLNKKTAASKLGPKLKDAEAELAKRDARELRSGSFELAGIALDAGDVIIEYTSAKPGYAGTNDNRGREAVVSTVITEELKLEGLARDVIRLVNQARKDSGLQIADTIALYLHSPAELLAKALATQKLTIASETQASEWSEVPLSADAYGTDSKVDGLALRIELRKV
jgi:isoleucyl-tRNA synthetase